jgi:putative flippase GtrA
MLNRKRYVKFLIVGAIGTIPNFIVFRMLKNINLNLAWLIGVLAGATFNYILNSKWVFND